MKKYKVWIELRGKGYATVEAESEEEAIKIGEEECLEGAHANLTQYDARAEEVEYQ